MSLTRMRRRMRRQIKIVLWVVAVVFLLTALLSFALVDPTPEARQPIGRPVGGTQDPGAG